MRNLRVAALRSGGSPATAFLAVFAFVSVMLNVYLMAKQPLASGADSTCPPPIIQSAQPSVVTVVQPPPVANPNQNSAKISYTYLLITDGSQLQEWRTRILYRSWERSGRPGKLHRLLSGVQTHPLNSLELITTQEMDNFAGYTSNLTRREIAPEYLDGIKAHALNQWLERDPSVRRSNPSNHIVVVLESTMAFAKYPQWENSDEAFVNENELLAQPLSLSARALLNVSQTFGVDLAQKYLHRNVSLPLVTSPYMARVSDWLRIAPTYSYFTALLHADGVPSAETWAIGLACAHHELTLHPLQTALIPHDQSWKAPYPDLALVKVEDVLSYRFYPDLPSEFQRREIQQDVVYSWSLQNAHEPPSKLSSHTFLPPEGLSSYFHSITEAIGLGYMRKWQDRVALMEARYKNFKKLPGLGGEEERQDNGGIGNVQLPQNFDGHDKLVRTLPPVRKAHSMRVSNMHQLLYNFNTYRRGDTIETVGMMGSPVKCDEKCFQTPNCTGWSFTWCELNGKCDLFRGPLSVNQDTSLSGCWTSGGIPL